MTIKCISRVSGGLEVLILLSFDQFIMKQGFLFFYNLDFQVDKTLIKHGTYCSVIEMYSVVRYSTVPYSTEEDFYHYKK